MCNLPEGKVLLPLGGRVSFLVNQDCQARSQDINPPAMKLATSKVYIKKLVTSNVEEYGH